MEYNLKPCPFCGGEASLSEALVAGYLHKPYVECIDCAASTDCAESQIDAIDKWERRNEKTKTRSS